MKSFRTYLEENALTRTMFHGSGSEFKKFEQSKARIPNDFYGGGVAYFTDNFDVAVTYAKSMAKKSKGDPIVYTVSTKFRKLFDISHIFTGSDLKNILPTDIEAFARGAGLLGFKVDNKYKVLGDLKAGKAILTGDQVFKGLSKGMNTTAKAREHLISKGYDGLRYDGGVNMGMATKHNVYLSYKASNISIKETKVIVKHETV